jgi:hypothetical protein
MRKDLLWLQDWGTESLFSLGIVFLTNNDIGIASVPKLLFRMKESRILRLKFNYTKSQIYVRDALLWVIMIPT